ncbi:Oxidoreductase, molybdopterin-binding [Olavius algarvensis associated proteobacterium Delta 3]|nr:Oxidoreductase, molybdopterin-binding [Olavius algarvensis associated proteobacterium Delta 3]
MKTITACTMDCPDACSLVVTVEEGKSFRLRGNPDHPITAGFTCKKIRNHVRRLQSPDRILHPLLKKNGKWNRIGWEQALDLCAEKINHYRGEPLSILNVQGSGALGALKSVTGLFFGRLGASRFRGSLCDAAGYMAFVHDFGSRRNNDIRDLTNASRIINWGKDLSRSSVHLAAMVRRARKKGARVLTISPGGDGNTSFSDDHIRIRPGTDRFLAAAAIRRMIQSDGIDAHIISHTKHWSPFRQAVESWTEAQLLESCGLTPAELETLLFWYRQKDPTATLVGTALQRYRYGGENARFINALALLAGHIGRSGGGSYYHLHAYGALNLDWARDGVPRSGRSFCKPTMGKEILEATDPPIRMAWFNGINIVNQAANSRQSKKALEGVEFVVVVDAFMNDTAAAADLILPSALMLEQEDVVGSYFHEYVQYVPAVLPPPAEARTDYWIMSELARRMNPPVEIPDPETVFSQSLTSPLLETTLEELRERGFVRTNRPPVAYEELQFDHADGKYRFPIALHPEPNPPDGYPLRLLSLIRREAMHSQILAEDQEIPPAAWVAPDCPAISGLDPAKDVFMVSPQGRLRVRLEVLQGLHPEVVVYRRGDWMKLGGGINQLIREQLTDMGWGAAYYDQYVRLEN